MNEKQARRLRQYLKYKPGPIARRGKDQVEIEGNKPWENIKIGPLERIRPYELIPCGKKLWTGKERHQFTTVGTGPRLMCTGLRWRYLRLKDAIHETNRL